MNILELQKLVSDTDAKIESLTPQLSAVVKTESMSQPLSLVDIPVIIDLGVVVLQAVKAFFFWKPKWQTAIGNVILFLQTFTPAP